MPYLSNHERRFQLWRDGSPAQTAGELNYQFTMLADRFLLDHGLSYATLNTVIGAIEAAKLELYRRVAAPYEDEKMDENGDVYLVLAAP